MSTGLCSKILGDDWNFASFWNSTELHSNACLEKTWLVWIPCSVFFALFVFCLVQKCRRGHRGPVEMTGKKSCWLCIVKMISVITVLVLCLIRSVMVPSMEKNKYGEVDTTEVLSLVLIAVCWLIITVLTYCEMRSPSFHDGTLQVVTSAAFVICGIPEFVRSATNITSGQVKIGLDIAMFILIFFAQLVVAILFSISHFHAEDRGAGLEESPEKRSSCFAKWFFFFYWRILIKGYRQILSHDDLWQLDESEQCANVCERFERWHKWARAKFRKFPTFSLVAAITGAYWRLICSTFLLIAIRELMAVLIIFDIQWMLQFASDKSEPRWHGWIYVAIASTALFVRGLCFQHKDFRMVKLCLRTKNALSATVLKKSLALSPDSRRIFSSGEIYNYAVLEASRLVEHMFVLHLPFSLVLQIGIGCYLLNKFIGVAFLAGIGVYAVCALISVLTHKIFLRYFYQKSILRDKRMRLLVELLTNMKLIKYYAWENAFKEIILKVRREENAKLRSTLIAGAPGDILLICIMQLAFLAVFSVYTFAQGKVPSSTTIFMTVAVFRFTLCDYASINEAIKLFVKTRMSMKRLAKFFAAEELDDYVEKCPRDGSDVSIAIIDGRLAWTSPAVFTFDRVNLTIPRGELVGVAGIVGSGKSSFISAISGEMRLNAGRVKIYGSVAYVPQQAWILNDTLRGNILFGRPYEKEKYYRIVEACALLPDLEILPAGDQTEIGERGVNLSGGQKQRISLARAVYQNCDIYLLDDPLSAVDVHVKEHLFENVIGPNGLLREKTRIFVTNTISYLPQCDRVILMEDGNIVVNGTYKEAAKNNALLASIRTSVEESKPEDEHSIREESPKPTINKNAMEIIEKPLMDITSRNTGKLIQEEIMLYGKVSRKTYWLYLKSGGVGMLFCAFFILAAYSFDIGAVFWMRRWSSSNYGDQQDQSVISNSKGIFVLAMLALSQFVVAILFAISSVIFAARTARVLHDVMLMSILRAPITFFDTTPIGRILSRFGREMHSVDFILYMMMILMLHSVSAAAISIIPSLMTTPLLAVFLVPAFIAFVGLQTFYVASARQFQRLEAVTKAPIYSYMHDVLSGAGNIRIYGRIQYFIRKFDEMLDKNLRPLIMLNTSVQWLSVNLIMTYEVIVTCAISMALMTSQLPPGSVAMSIVFIMGLSDTLLIGIRRMCELETEMISVERIQQYLQIPSEAAWESDKAPNRRRSRRRRTTKGLYGTFGGKASTNGCKKYGRSDERQSLLGSGVYEHNGSTGGDAESNGIDSQPLGNVWPTVGRIQFVNYSLRYRPELPLALNGLNLTVEGGERVGIVGRTGAGKTSLTVGLFRLIEPSSGTIVIDSVDVTTIGLHELRRVMTVIPQDPALFYGTLRLNMDPFDEYSDHQIWTALENSHLKQFINALPSGLDSQVEDGGSNMSVGQRQLICLARALLRQSKILVLDEATACVDLETDRLIQTTIRTKFVHCTVITIAHRLETIMDYDKVAVFDEGKCVEYGSVEDLLANESGRFARMVYAAGLHR